MRGAGGLTWWMMRYMVEGSRRTMPASASARMGSAPALVLRPGRPMLSASITPSRPLFFGSALRAAGTLTVQSSSMM